MYFQNEKYLLPFSHDEVVHGKATILQKMNGQYEQKFPQARAMYLYMLVHPGKKLNFMGNEFGQLREWNEKREQDWDLRKYPNHDAFYHYMAKLNDIYISHPALFEWDYRTDGFYWLDCHQENRCIYAICRKGKGEYLAAVFNFSDQVQMDYTVAIPGAIVASPLVYSDWEEFGGTTPRGKAVFQMKKSNLTCTLQPFSALLMDIKQDGANTY